jgi:hypothetical protein
MRSMSLDNAFDDHCVGRWSDRNRKQNPGYRCSNNVTLFHAGDEASAIAN